MAVTRSKAIERVATTYGPLHRKAGDASEVVWLAAVAVLIACGLFLVFKAKIHAFGEIEQGLASKIVFVVSARLRVSEEALEGTDSAALYVYKGAINPKALINSQNRIS